MQANNKGTDIPANVLKNFNPYEILQPQKVTDTKYNLLIDINDDCREYGKHNPIQTDLDTTLPKINPDLIDLFENVLISPLQIENSNKYPDNIEEWPLLNDSSEPGCSNEGIKRDVCENNTPKILTPPSIDNIDLDIKNTDNNKVNELKDDDTDNMQSSSKYDLEDHDDLLEEILQSKSFEMTYRNTEVPLKNMNYTVNQATDLKHNVTLENITSKLLEAVTKDKIDIVNEAMSLKLLEAVTKEKADIVNEAMSLKLLETVTKDEKIFIKKFIKCNDRSNYTRGPSIYEKSLLLPQIMERLSARKTVLEGRKNLQRRLILDAGTECSVSMPELNPTVLMEDCNRYRLIGFKTREGFEHFIRTGRF